MKLRKILCYFYWFVGVFIVLILAAVIVFKVSVKPGVFVIQHMFNHPLTILDEKAFELASAKVNKLENITYTSTFSNNLMDIYYPNTVDKARAILFWVHGGGFVAGDKEALEEFATYIAANNQIAVVTINYETAPKSVFPGQVKQLDEAYNFLKKHYSNFISVNFSKILFGGDSAGGQISGQYVALQTNKKYAKELQINPSIPVAHLIAFISYSAPVNLQQMTDVQSSSLFMKFFVSTVARAFIGTNDWKNSPKLKQASVAEHVTKQFPPTFITDGNTYSFQEQGQMLEEKLKVLNVSVQSLFYADSNQEVPHEYQFNYKTQEAKACLQKTIAFIEEQLAY